MFELSYNFWILFLWFVGGGATTPFCPPLDKASIPGARKITGKNYSLRKIRVRNVWETYATYSEIFPTICTLLLKQDYLHSMLLWYKSCNWDPWRPWNDFTGITVTADSRDSTSTCLVCRWDGVPLGGQTQCVKVGARNILGGGRQGPRPLSLTPHYLAYCISEYVRCASTSARQGQRWLIMCPEVERDGRRRIERACQKSLASRLSAGALG